MRAPVLPDAQWRPDGTGVTSGGDCGGDAEAGEDFYSVGYVRPDRPRSLITVTFYPVEYDELPGEFVVQRQVEWLVCEDPADPGGTEVWSDGEHDDVSGTVWDTAAEAEREAQEFAADALERGWTHAWDGYSDPRARYRPEGDHWACWKCGNREYAAYGDAHACLDCSELS
jgi:hypothetical protein